MKTKICFLAVLLVALLVPLAPCQAADPEVTLIAKDHAQRHAGRRQPAPHRCAPTQGLGRQPQQDYRRPALFAG